VQGDLVASYIRDLHEMAVYKLALFQVSDHPPQVMRPVENPLVILFTQLTIVQVVLNPNEMFPEWTYSLTSFAELPEPHDTPPRLIGGENHTFYHTFITFYLHIKLSLGVY
jgi:hypothetical protein